MVPKMELLLVEQTVEKSEFYWAVMLDDSSVVEMVSQMDTH
jgi:hypothetical protein